MRRKGREEKARRERTEARVAGEVDHVEDAETSPPVPSATLAARAAAVEIGRARRALVAGTGQIWILAWPVMLSQLLVTGVSLADIAMVGRLGPGAVAAVGYATQFFFMTQASLFAVGFACVALMTRAIGAGDVAGARRSLAASVLVGVGTALLVAAAVLVAPRAILRLLNAEAAVIELSVPYLRLVLGSSLLLAVSLVLESGMRADRNTVTPMRIASVVALTKVVLSALLIFGLAGMPRLELVGAGLATVVSQVLGVGLFAWVVLRSDEASPVALGWHDFAGAGAYIGSVVRIAAPGVGERIILNLALLSYFALLGRYGTVAVAAYTVGVRALSFSWIPGTAFGAAVATLVGQALGRGDPDEAEAIGVRAARLAVFVAVVLGTVAGVARYPIARVFTNDAATIATLGPFMLCLAWAQPMLQLHFTLAGIHRGAGDSWTPMVAATIGNWGLRVPLASLCALVWHSSLVWLWTALIFDHTARAAWLLRSLRRGEWKTSPQLRLTATT